MAKFGEIISSSTPTLIDFFSVNEEGSLLQNIATAIGDKVRIIKIDTAKNEQLVEALRINRTPTFVIYKNSEMKWRQSGKQDADTLINLIEQFV